MTAIRIAVIDDHDLVAVALQALLTSESDLAFTRHAHTTQALVASPHDFDLVVLDLQLRDGSTPESNMRLLTSWGFPTLILTSGEDPYLVRSAARTSALGIIRKSAPPEVILSALREAGNGHRVVSPEWASALDSDPLLATADLTDREREVLELYASGVSAKHVASQLFISENTVNDHLRRIRRIYDELGRPAGTKVELYQRSIEDGYVPLPRRE